MSQRILAQRYAEALADVAERHDMLDEVRAELDALSDSVTGNKLFEIFMASSRMSHGDKKDAMRDLADRVGLQPVLKRLLVQLVDKERLSLLSTLAEEYSEEADRRLDIQDAQVVTAMELSEEQREKIKNKLEQVTGKTIRMNERVDRSLLAGLQIRLNNKFFEGSLKGRLRRLRERMSYAGNTVH